VREGQADTSLWPIVLTGAFALGGSLGAMGINSLATARRDAAQEHREERKRRSDKFEELVAALYEFDHWLENMRQRAFGIGDTKETVSPFAKVQSIAAVYFPQFSGLIGELDMASGQYRVWIYNAEQLRLANAVARLLDGFNEAHIPYVQKREDLLTALKKFAHEEFSMKGGRQHCTGPSTPT
jgi:hypothetical protein